MSPEREIHRLKKKLRYHAECYYIDNDPEIADIEWDRMYDRLVKLELENPHLITWDSPTRHVGAAIARPSHPGKRFGVDMKLNGILAELAAGQFNALEEMFFEMSNELRQSLDRASRDPRAGVYTIRLEWEDDV